MAGRPKLARLLASLQLRAERDLGDDATALDYVDYVVEHIAGGGFLSALAEDLAAELGESVSRPFLSGAVHALAPDAKSRIEGARREGAAALAEYATTIADRANETTAGVAKARLQSDTRRWLAERFDPAHFGSSTKAEVTVTLGQLHIEALKAANLKRAADATATLLPGSGSSLESEGDA
jgi:hypothetical protein